ncbi:MAG: hypothetical protein LC797_02255 [Chloroflexi bacterium]|nr:hypothetical protein [Chloroflexota bacterium]
MIIALAWAALRRHPFSVACAGLLAMLSASLLGTPAPLAMAMWAATSVCGVALWRTLEPVVLHVLGCRAPGPIERLRLDRVLGVGRLDVVVLDTAEPWLGRGLRSLVVSRALFDLLNDREILGCLTQAAEQVRSASLAGELVVWLGNLPLLGVWLFARWIAQLGRLLALVVGSSLVLPLILWPAGFLRWAGRLFGSGLVALLGAVLLSSGLAAPGLGLLLAWALVPALQVLLAWESRRAEQIADQATIAAGLGWHLLEALEVLGYAESLPPPDGVLGLLCRRGSPLTTRAERVWRALAES